MVRLRRRLLYLIAFALVPVFADVTSSYAVPTMVQATAAAGTYSTSFTCSYAAAPTTGNLGVMWIGSGSNGSVTTPSGWSVLLSGTSFGVGNNAIFYKTLSSADTFTSITGSGSIYGCTKQEISGSSLTPTIGATPAALATAASATSITVSQVSNPLTIASTGGIVLEEYFGLNESTAATSLSDSPPSGVTTTIAGAAFGAANDYSIGSFYTSGGTDPYNVTSSTHVYGGNAGTFSHAESKLSAIDVFVPAPSPTPSPGTSGCGPYVYPCSFRTASRLR